MAYKVIFSKLAEKAFLGLSKTFQMQIAKRLNLAAENPKPFVKKLTGLSELSLRAGDYMLIVNIDETAKLIMVLDVGHRREIYKK